LETELGETAPDIARLQQHSCHPSAMAGVTDKTTFEKCNVEHGREDIDELEPIGFPGQTVFVFPLGSVHFCQKTVTLANKKIFI
jgi:hypothetical protein